MTESVAKPNVEAPPPDEPFTYSVELHTGAVLVVGGVLPSNDPSKPGDIKVFRIFERDDGAALIYALPLPGSEFDKLQQGFIFTIPAISIKQFLSLARFDVWQEMLAVEASGEEDEGDDVAVNGVTGATIPIAPLPLNGAS